MRGRTICLAALLAVLLGNTLRADERPVFILGGWGGVIDPDRDCTLSYDRNVLSMFVPGKPHDYSAELGRWNAPRVLTPAFRDFTVQVRVGGAFPTSDRSLIDGRKPYNGAGLLIVADARNYVSLHRGAVNLGTKVRPYANFEQRKDGRQVVSRFEHELEEREVYLRIERTGKRFVGSTSYDGKAWEAYDAIEADFPERLTVGVVAVNSASAGFGCTFADFSVVGR